VSVPAVRMGCLARAAVLAGSIVTGCSERIGHTDRLLIEPARPESSSAGVNDAPDIRAFTGQEVRVPSDGLTLPVVAPDGRSFAVQARTTASWAVRIGDPLPPDGLDTHIEAWSLDSSRAGTKLRALDGPWLLGRAATDDGFLVERPREDGGRDIALAGWRDGIRMIAEDGWTNAFAAASASGDLAWSRRRPEGGDWQLVIERGGRRRAIGTRPGVSWLFPSFAGDGSGLFALRMEGTAIALAWIRFDDAGPPGPDAVEAAITSPLTVQGNLSAAARASEPSSGLSASPPGRGDLAIWSADHGTTVIWAPGAEPEALGPAAVAATVVDDENALCTEAGGLRRDRITARARPGERLLDGAWVTRPTTRGANPLVAIRPDGGELVIAPLRLQPATSGADLDPQK
jgi:hypothetical protein